MRRFSLAIVFLLALIQGASAQVCPGGSTCATLDSYLGGHLALGGALTSTGSGTFGLGGAGVTLTFQGTDTYIGRATTDTLTNKTLTSPTIAAGVLSGTFSGAPTFSGNLTFSGVPILSGLSAGTIASGKNLGLDASNNLVTATVSGSGGLTVGTSPITGGTTGKLFYDNAGVLGEATVGSGLSLTSGTLTATGASVTFGADFVNSSGTINLAQRTTHGDSAYNILSSDRYVVTSAALTATRTWTLPAASTLPAGTMYVIQDEAGGVTGTNNLAVAPNGTDTINGANNATLSTIGVAFGGIALKTDGSAKWSVVFNTILQACSASANTFMTGINASGQCLFSTAPVLVAGGGTGLTTLTANTLYKGNGTSALAASSIVDNSGVTIGSPTGGAQGAGTLNATNLFVNGVAVGAGSGWELTDGTHDLTGVTKVTVSGATVGGTTPNATLTVSGGGGSGAVTIVTPTGGGGISGNSCVFDNTATSCTWAGLTTNEAELHCNAVLGTAGEAIGIQFGTGAGPTWGTGTTDYTVQSVYFNSSSATGQNLVTQPAIFPIALTSSGSGTSYDMELKDLGIGGLTHRAVGTGGQSNTTSSLTNTGWAEYNANTTAVTAVRVFVYSASPHNLTAGTCRLYAKSS